MDEVIIPSPTPPHPTHPILVTGERQRLRVHIYIYRICSRSQPSKLMFCKFYVTNIHSDGDNPGMCIFEVSDICELILNNRWSLKYVSQILTQPMDPEKNSLNFIFPTKYVIPKSLKFSHWLSGNWEIFPFEGKKQRHALETTTLADTNGSTFNPIVTLVYLNCCIQIYVLNAFI